LTNLPRKPAALREGARVALLAPAGPVSAERLERSIERCRLLQLEPIVYATASQRHRYLAAPDAQRLSDLQDAFNDDTIDAVWALRGGYGTTRILQQLDVSRLQSRPKAFIGFSDNTAVHALLAARGIVSFHGPHPGSDFPAETEAAFRSILFRAAPAGVLPLRVADPLPRPLVGGAAEAPLVGGNLALLAALCGTPANISARGHILFVEDVGEPAYRVDRLFVQLRDAGVLAGIRGLALGRFSNTPDEQDDDVECLLREFAEALNVPAVLDLPIGHVQHNWTLPIGVHARLDADRAQLEIIEAAVTE
jgi:muramoyltetrapeptide carboxypeptidase